MVIKPFFWGQPNSLRSAWLILIPLTTIFYFFKSLIRSWFQELMAAEVNKGLPLASSEMNHFHVGKSHNVLNFLCGCGVTVTLLCQCPTKTFSPSSFNFLLAATLISDFRSNMWWNCYSLVSMPHQNFFSVFIFLAFCFTFFRARTITAHWDVLPVFYELKCQTLSLSLVMLWADFFLLVITSPLVYFLTFYPSLNSSQEKHIVSFKPDNVMFHAWHILYYSVL